jgi:predicted MFS family arabinose efflux permease
VNVPIGLVAAPLVLARMRESRGPQASLDMTGLTLVTLGAIGVVWGLVRGNQVGWGSVEVLASLSAGVLLIMGFIRWELRAREPMLPMSFFRSRAFSAGNAAIFFTFAALFGTVFFYAQLLQTALGYGPLAAGLRLLPYTATFMTVAPIAGALADHIGERPLLIGGLALQTAGLAWLASIATPDLAYSQMLAPFIIAGVGVSMAIPAAQNAVVGSVASEALGKAAGVNSMMRELGGVFGIALAVAVFAATGGYASAQAFTDGFGPAIGVAAGLAFVGMLAAVALPSRRTAAVQANALQAQEATQ